MRPPAPLLALWQRYAAWFAARQPRERTIVAVAAVGGLWFLGYSYAIAPAMSAAQRDERLAAEARATATQSLGVVTVLKAQNADPDAPLRAELDQLRLRLAEQSKQFQAVDRSLVPPERVPALLESLLSRSRSLQLVSLRTLPPTPVIERTSPKAGTSAAGGAQTAIASTAAAAEAAGLPNLFKHGVEIRIAGSYADLLAYLAELENAPQRLIWGRMDLSVDAYPRSVLTLTVYTLSLEKSWLVL